MTENKKEVEPMTMEEIREEQKKPWWERSVILQDEPFMLLPGQSARVKLFTCPDGTMPGRELSGGGYEPGVWRVLGYPGGPNDTEFPVATEDWEPIWYAVAVDVEGTERPGGISTQPVVVHKGEKLRVWMDLGKFKIVKVDNE